MSLLAMLLACCTAASPAASAPAAGVDTVAVYARVVAAIRAELPPGAPRIYLADERFDGSRGKHPAGLLRELASRGVVDGVFAHERRSPTFPCLDCTRIMLGPVVEHDRVLPIDPDDPSREADPSRAIPVKHWVDVQVARTCSPEGLRSGSCTEGSVGAACRGGEFHSRRYYFTREEDDGLRLVACAVTGVV